MPYQKGSLSISLLLHCIQDFCAKVCYKTIVQVNFLSNLTVESEKNILKFSKQSLCELLFLNSKMYKKLLKISLIDSFVCKRFCYQSVL